MRADQDAGVEELLSAGGSLRVDGRLGCVDITREALVDGKREDASDGGAIDVDLLASNAGDAGRAREDSNL